MSDAIHISTDCKFCQSKEAFPNGDRALDGTMYVSCWDCGQSFTSDIITRAWALLATLYQKEA
jgi:hypothetical protein